LSNNQIYAIIKNGIIVLQGGCPLFYIEWGWCLWTRKRRKTRICL